MVCLPLQTGWCTFSRFWLCPTAWPAIVLGDTSAGFWYQSFFIITHYSHHYIKYWWEGDGVKTVDIKHLNGGTLLLSLTEEGHFWSVLKMTTSETIWSTIQFTYHSSTNADQFYYESYMAFTMSAKLSAAFLFLPSFTNPYSQTRLRAQFRNKCASILCALMSMITEPRRSGEESAASNSKSTWSGLWTNFYSSLQLRLNSKPSYDTTPFLTHASCKWPPTRAQLLNTTMIRQQDASTKRTFTQTKGRVNTSAGRILVAQHSPACS